MRASGGCELTLGMHAGRARPDRVAPRGEDPLGMPKFISGIRSARPEEYGGRYVIWKVDISCRMVW